jgi:hypothetical protein
MMSDPRLCWLEDDLLMYAIAKAAIQEMKREGCTFDDSTENATQRGNSGTAIAGSVASAIQFLAKDILTGGKHVRQNYQTSCKGLQTLQGQLASEKGIGRDVVLKFLDGVRGIKESIVQAQLANLKASGDYQRIVGEVTAQIKQEQKQ